MPYQCQIPEFGKGNKNTLKNLENSTIIYHLPSTIAVIRPMPMPMPMPKGISALKGSLTRAAGRLVGIGLTEPAAKGGSFFAKAENLVVLVLVGALVRQH